MHRLCTPLTVSAASCPAPRLPELPAAGCACWLAACLPVLQGLPAIVGEGALLLLLLKRVLVLVLLLLKQVLQQL